jgi:hypothetical protein
VRGGTYFSLPRQRKVGKRKPLTPTHLTHTHDPSTAQARILRRRSHMGPLRVRGQKQEFAGLDRFLCLLSLRRQRK